MQLNPLAQLIRRGSSKEAGENERGIFGICQYLVTTWALDPKDPDQTAGEQADMALSLPVENQGGLFFPTY